MNNLPVKRTVGETLRERLTENACERMLPARYLQKDEHRLPRVRLHGLRGGGSEEGPNWWTPRGGAEKIGERS